MRSADSAHRPSAGIQNQDLKLEQTWNDPSETAELHPLQNLHSIWRKIWFNLGNAFILRAGPSRDLHFASSSKKSPGNSRSMGTPMITNDQIHTVLFFLQSCPFLSALLLNCWCYQGSAWGCWWAPIPDTQLSAAHLPHLSFLCFCAKAAADNELSHLHAKRKPVKIQTSQQIPVWAKPHPSLVARWINQAAC